MDFNTFLDTIIDSSAENWVLVHDPIGLQILDQQTMHDGEGERQLTRVYSLRTVATFRPNLSIQMAVFSGPGDDRPFEQDWAQKSFYNQKAVRRWLYLLWNGNSVFRVRVAIVDDVSCFLPIPRLGTLEVPERLDGLVYLVHEVFGTNYSYSSYREAFRVAGLTVSTKAWPSD